MRFWKLLFVLALISNTAQAKVSLEVEKLYYVKVKATKDIVKDLGMSQCQNFKESFPAFSTVQKFMDANNCQISKESVDHTILYCEAPKGKAADVYYLFTKEGCEETIASGRRLLETPGIEEDLRAAQTAKWFMFELHENPDRVTNCAESDPKDLRKSEVCFIADERNLTQVYSCKTDKGVDYVKTFVKGSGMCNRTKQLMIKELEAEKKN